MAIQIKIELPKYKAPTQEDIEAAKRFILDREEYAALLSDEIDSRLGDAAERIVLICYAYGIEPTKLLFSTAFNENMMNEISSVMDDLESEVLELIYENSLQVTDDEARIESLREWMASLGKGDKDLEATLDDYLYKTMKDWEAAIAAMMYAKMSVSEAVTTIKTHLHSIYTIPAVLAAFKIAERFAAKYIAQRGVQPGAVGISNNGSTNVVNMAKTTLQMTWMRSQALDFEAQGAAGYYQLRGSDFPCDICDEEEGFHEDINEILTKSYPHPHCQCFRVPIYINEE